MSQALDLLNSLTPDEVSRLAGNGSDEPHIVIGEDRAIYVPPELRRVAVQFDHAIETVTFECPRYWDGLDLSAMSVSINYMLANGYKDKYPAAIKGYISEDRMLFDWEITSNVTPVSGRVSFLVCITKTDVDTGKVLHHWSSELCQDMYVSEGMECEESPIISDPDMVSQVLQRLADNEYEILGIKNDLLDGVLPPNTTEADNGKILTVVSGEPRWAFRARGLTAAQIAAIQGLFEIAAYTEDASTAYQAFLDAFAEPECQHEYDNACDATCNLCGAVRATEHSYGVGVVTKPADYGVDGVMTYTCTICGATKTEVIPALVPPVLTAVYSPKTPNNLRVNFDYDTDDADAIRDWLTVTDEGGNTITDYTLSKNADGDVVVSHHGATTTVDVERNTFTVLGGGVDIVRGSTNSAYSKQGAGFPYTEAPTYLKVLYPHFITAKAGYSYTFAIEMADTYTKDNADRGAPKIIVAAYNSQTMTSVANHENINYGDESTGWVDTSKTGDNTYAYTFEPQEIANGTPRPSFRFVLQSPDSAYLTAGQVESVTITATPVTS